MGSALEYLAKTHEVLAQGGIKLCGLIHVEISEILQNEGKTPYLILVNIDYNGNIHTNKKISPIIYGGGVQWGVHIVTGCGGEAWDPLIGKPVPLEHYCRLAFGEDFPIISYGPDSVK